MIELSIQERFGLPKKGLQVNSIDRKTRIRVWNTINFFLWKEIFISTTSGRLVTLPEIKKYIYNLWSGEIGWNYDLIDNNRDGLVKQFSGYLMTENLSWSKFLSFTEKVLHLYLDAIDLLEETRRNSNSPNYIGSIFESYVQEINKVFIQEACGYRFIGIYICPIIDEVEVLEISNALDRTESISSVKLHLQNAMMLLSDRERPDYSNSIKESISALEALCRRITGDPNATLSKAITKIEPLIKLHPALKESIVKLYGWAGDAPGIRHAGKDGETEDFDRAKLTLVLCSGLTNYLITKSEEAGIGLHN